MECFECHSLKLSREFPEVIAKTCKHVPNFCLMCTCKALSQKLACPNPDCNEEVDKATEEELRQQLCNLQLFQNEKKNVVEPIKKWSGTILVSKIDGQTFSINNVTGLTTIKELKERIMEKTSIIPSKQQLIYGGKDLKVRVSNDLTTLNKYNVKNGDTLLLLILLYEVKEDLKTVRFDLYWGFPLDGRVDFLDASCLVFAGKKLKGIVDYKTQRSKATTATTKTATTAAATTMTTAKIAGIMHTGDKMDKETKSGNHQLTVDIPSLPADVTCLVFALSALNSPTIGHFVNPSVRMFDIDFQEKELCKTSIATGSESRAIVMCYMTKTSNGWFVLDGGLLSDGFSRNYDPLIETIINSNILQEKKDE